MMERELEVEAFPVGQIATRPEWQVRAKLDPGTIDRYATAYKAGAEELPPLSLARIEGVLFVVDGWHRLEAAKRAGLSRIGGRVVTKDPQEARWLAAKANTAHGLPLKKREYRNVLAAFIGAGKHLKGRRMLSYRDLAKELGGTVAHTTVRGWVMADFPAVAAKMRDDAPTGNRQAGPGWSKASDSPEAVAVRHLDSFLAILGGLPEESREGLRRMAEDALNPLKDHAEF